MATYYALDALDALDARQNRSPAAANAAREPGIGVAGRPEGLHRSRSRPTARAARAEAVDLAGALRIHLWGAKNARPGGSPGPGASPTGEGVPVTFFVANEEYGTWVDVPGLGTYSHTSDVIAPAGADFGPSLANQGVVTWPEFRERRLDRSAGGRRRA